jgi:flagellar motor switch protein FliM
MAGSAELDVAALSSVAPGDVILLDTALEATFALVNTEGLAIAKGYLGALGDRKAFQLTT